VIRNWSGISGSYSGGGTVVDDLLEERREEGVLAVGRSAAETLARVAVEHRELELLFRGVEIDEQVVDLVDHLVDARVGAVDLVDYHDRRQVGLERLAQHEAGLRQRALGGIDEQHDAVDHLQVRSTSPPKSAWPGVSTMLIRVPCR
jgi:hypothetical protein